MCWRLREKGEMGEEERMVSEMGEGAREGREECRMVNTAT